MENNETVGARNKPKLTFWQNFKLYGNDYTENASIHGVRYMGENRNHFEKLWWICVFVASLYLCSGRILITYDKWRTSPVIVSFAQSPKPIWQIPFPAVTICPEVKTLIKKFKFSKYFLHHVERKQPLHQSQLEKFQSIFLVCDSDQHNKYNNGTPYAVEGVLDHITKASPILPNYHMFLECRWNNEKFPCRDYFKRIFTEDGICYTFNMLDRDDIYKDNGSYYKDFQKQERNREGWTLEYGYKTDKRESFPKRAESTVTNNGLTMRLFSMNRDVDQLCREAVGFKILLHNPTETPWMATEFFRLPFEREFLVAVKPDMMNTSDVLRKYSPDERKCYFSSERPLQFYKNYTQRNCEVECLANFTLTACGCVAFYMPRVEGTKICGIGKTNCTRDARGALLDREVIKAINESKIDVCNCIPACTSLVYNHEISQAPFDVIGLYSALNITPYYKDMNHTSIYIYLKENQFIPSERQELYGLADFLAKCGGLLNLFIGFSVLSLIEMIYFLTLRLFNNVRRYGKNFWSGVEVTIDDNEGIELN